LPSQTELRGGLGLAGNFAMKQDQLYSCDFAPCFMSPPTQVNMINEIVFHYEKYHLDDIAALLTVWTMPKTCLVNSQCKFIAKKPEHMAAHLPYHGRIIIALYFELKLDQGKFKPEVCFCKKSQIGIVSGKCIKCGKSPSPVKLILKDEWYNNKSTGLDQFFFGDKK
jgi:hypothetical protein